MKRKSPAAASVAPADDLRLPVSKSPDKIREIRGDQLAHVSDSGHNNRVKPVDFHPKALDFIRAQPVSVRQQIGEALRDLQKGVQLGMPLSRPMADVTRGVNELRIKAKGLTIRVFYCLGRSDAIIVFHAFQKKSHKTPVREINLARQRLQEVLGEAIEP